MSCRNAILLAAVLTLCLLLTASCTLINLMPVSLPAPKEVQITEKEGACGSTVGLDIGDTLVLIVDANQSTGYSWEVGFYVPEVIQPQGEPVYKPVSDLAGSGDSATFRFLAVGEGQVALRLIYHRAWEKDVPELETCEVTINVTPAKK